MRSEKLWYFISTLICITILSFSMVIKANLIRTYKEVEYQTEHSYQEKFKSIEEDGTVVTAEYGRQYMIYDYVYKKVDPNTGLNDNTHIIGYTLCLIIDIVIVFILIPSSIILVSKQIHKHVCLCFRLGLIVMVGRNVGCCIGYLCSGYKQEIVKDLQKTLYSEIGEMEQANQYWLFGYNFLSIDFTMVNVLLIIWIVNLVECIKTHSQSEFTEMKIDI